MELYLVLKNELKDFYIKFLNSYKTYNLPYMIIEVKTNNDYIEEKNELGGVISFCEFKLLGRYWYYSKEGKLWDEIQYKNWKDGFKNCVDSGGCNDNLNLYYNEKGFKVFKTYNDALIYLEDLYCSNFREMMDIGYPYYNKESKDVRVRNYLDIDYNSYKELKKELFNNLDSAKKQLNNFLVSQEDYEYSIKKVDEFLLNIEKFCIGYKDLKLNYENNFIDKEEYNKEVKNLLYEIGIFIIFGSNDELLLKYLTQEELEEVTQICNLSHICENNKEFKDNKKELRFGNVDSDSIEIISDEGCLKKSLFFTRYGIKHKFFNVEDGIGIIEDKRNNKSTITFNIENDFPYKIGDYIVDESDVSDGYGCSFIVSNEENYTYTRLMLSDNGNNFKLTTVSIGPYDDSFSKYWRYATEEEIRDFRKKLAYRNDIIFDEVNSYINILDLEDCTPENKKYFYPNCDIVYYDELGENKGRKGKFIKYQKDSNGIQNQMIIKLDDDLDILINRVVTDFSKVVRV